MPDEPTVVRNIQVRMDPAPADGVGHAFDVVVNGVRTRVCNFRGPATGCSQAEGSTIRVQAGALLHVGSLALIGENALTEATLRWGMTIGAE